LKPAFLALLGGAGPTTLANRTVVQRNRLGQSSDFFIFPLANTYAYAGNDVIDAHTLFAGIPDGQLPSVGFTAYGGPGDDLIIGSQAGDHLAGGSGDDTILGKRGVDHIYGDSGVNVDPITRVLTIPTVNASVWPSFDPLTVGRDALYGEGAGFTAADVSGNFDDVIFGDHGIVMQDTAEATVGADIGPFHGGYQLPARPQKLRTTGRIQRIETAVPDKGDNDTIQGNTGADRIFGGK